MIGAPSGREGEERHQGRPAEEPPGALRREHGDLGQLGRRWIGVDAAVGEDEEPIVAKFRPVRRHQHEGGDSRDAGTRADAAQGGAQGLGRRGPGAGDHAIESSSRHTQCGEQKRIADVGPGLVLCDPLRRGSLAVDPNGLLRGGSRPRNSGHGGGTGIELPLSGGLGDGVGIAQQRDAGETVPGRLESRLEGSWLVALGQDDMAKRLTCTLMEPLEKTRHCGLETSTDGAASSVGPRERPDRRRGEPDQRRYPGPKAAR